MEKCPQKKKYFCYDFLADILPILQKLPENLVKIKILSQKPKNNRFLMKFPTFFDHVTQIELHFEKRHLVAKNAKVYKKLQTLVW